MKPNETNLPAVDPAAGSNQPSKKKPLELAEWAKKDLDSVRSDLRELFSDKYVVACLIAAAVITGVLIALPFLTPGY